MGDLVIAADAGPSAGGGHLARCSGLGAALLDQGASVVSLALGAERKRRIDDVDWAPSAATDGILAVEDLSVVVLDSYRSSPQDRRTIAARAPLVVFHDDAGAPPEASLVLAVAGDEGRGRLVGLPYACLRRPFWDVPQRQPERDVRRVLICTGTADSEGIGARWATIARDALPTGTTILISGARGLEDAPEGVVAIGAQETLRDELLAADVVVTAAGQTVLEALATGSSCIAIATAENQLRQAETVAASGAACVLKNPSDEQLSTALVALAEDFGLRRRLSQCAQKTVDGQGARRIATHVLSLM